MQLLEFLTAVLRQQCLCWCQFNEILKRLLQLLHERLPVRRSLDLCANVRLQRLQPLKVDLRIEAKCPPPICRATHIGETRTIRSLFQNDEADVKALVPYRIPRVATHKEMKLLPISR